MLFTVRYGIDAPFWVAFLIIIGTIFTCIGIFGDVQLFVLGYGIICLMIGLWMFLYSTMIKVIQREKILNDAKIVRENTVLDVGTGAGLLAIAAAKRGCQVTAMDIWSKWDLAGNRKALLKRNMKVEKVTTIHIVEADARNIPFPDHYFERVVSNFLLHNIKGKKEKQKAIQEMWRVLCPQGQIVIVDIGLMSEAVQLLKEKTPKIEVKWNFTSFPFSKIVIARKLD